MIRIRRIDLDDELVARLTHRTKQLEDADSTVARFAWQTARQEKTGIRKHLNRMAPGIQRCMYCADSLGTDIDHFEPIKEFPAGAFEWLNHLLACSFCNSNAKRDRFPRSADGQPLLIDPTRDDPVEHLRLILRSGEYRALTIRGAVALDVFGLNRRDLTRGRAGAFEMAKAALCRADVLLSQDRRDEAVDCMEALAEQPHASVLREMQRSSDLPGANEVLGHDVVAALKNSKLVAILTPAPLSA